MKLWKNCLSVVGLGLLLMLVSCSVDVSRDATEGFLSGLSTMTAGTMMSEPSQILNDFQKTEPPGPKLSDYVSTFGAELSVEKLRAAPPSIDSLFGTWRLLPIDGWTHVDTNNPANAIRFEWEYFDSTDDSLHKATVLFDSLEFYLDSLPTDVWVGIKIDDDITWLAWLKLEVEYTSLEEASQVSLIYEIVDYYQVGVSVTAPIELDTTFSIDSTDFVGTIHLWAINLTNDYRVDLTITRNADDSGELVLEDSDGWKMEVDVSAPDTLSYPGYERRSVSGEITRNGNHAADIDGYIWDPEDGNHTTEITVTFNDGSVGNLLAYMAEGLLALGD